MIEAAKEHMLEGREPASEKDWALVMNFLAANTAEELAKPACRLMATLYDMPLTEEDVDAIVQYQIYYRRRHGNGQAT
jgi:hypothetical protein